MSRYICFSQNGQFDVSFEEVFSKAKNPGGFFRKKRFLGSIFGVFSCSVAISEPIYILAPGLKLNIPATLFYKKIISTSCSRVKDPHFLAQKQPKKAIFEKADYWGLKDPLEVRVQHKTLVLCFMLNSHL